LVADATTTGDGVTVPSTKDNVRDAAEFGFEQGHLSQVEERGLRDCGTWSSGVPSDSGFPGGRPDPVDYADLAATGRDVWRFTAVAATARLKGMPRRWDSERGNRPRLAARVRRARAGAGRLRRRVVGTDRGDTGRDSRRIGGYPVRHAFSAPWLSADPEGGRPDHRGIIAAVLVVTLSGAILGGPVALCFHRTVDRAGVGH